MGNLPADETIDGTYPFEPHFTDAPGFKMHYVDEGQGETLLLLHGFPTWSYLYRNYIPQLSENYRVIAPDNMGYGKSEGPKDRTYTFLDHSRNIDALVDDLGLSDITLILHDIGGPIGAGFAFRNPEKVKRIIIQNTVVFGMDPEFEVKVMTAGEENKNPYLDWIAEKHSQGDFLTLYDNMDATLPGLFTNLPLVWKTPWNHQLSRAYTLPWRERESRVAVEQMARRVYVSVIEGRGPGEFHVPTADQAKALREKPAMMICGMRDRAVVPAAMIKLFRNAFPGAPVVELPDTGHFVQEDSHEAAVAAIRLFLQMT